MKKLTIIVLTIFGMALASYAGNVTNTQFSGNGDNTTIEIAKPHTQQFKDMKEVLDAYEQAVQKAASCEDLDNAAIAMFIQLMTVAENEYDEEMNSEEEKELSEQMDRIEKKVNTLEEKWGCQPEEEEEEADEDVELIETSTEEWEAIINEFDGIVTQMEKMQNLDFDKDENVDKLVEVVMPLQQISERMDRSSVDNITDKQTRRLEEINNRLVTVATALGLLEDDE